MVPELYQGDSFCAKCRGRRPMQNAWIKVSDYGRRVAQGDCPDCGTKMYRIFGRVAPTGLGAVSVPVTTEGAEPRSTEGSYGTVTLLSQGDTYETD